MRQRKYKSIITKRIFRSVKKLSVILFLLFFGLSLGKIGGTNSFFADTATSSGNTMTAGYWTPPTISISSPLAGDEWQVGSAHDINWSAASADPAATAGMAIGIDYACDGGLWTNIIAGTANDGTFSWTVPADISNNCQIKVTATDSHALTDSVDSGIFKISWMIVLNEFLPNPPGDASVERGPKPFCEWVELYNNGTTPIDVSGWYLYDADNSHALPITSTNSDNDNDPGDSGETIVPAHGWLVVYQNGDTDFSLNNGGDTVRLYDGSIGSGANLLDSHTYSTSNVNDTDPNNTKGSTNTLDGNLSENGEGKTFARVPDGTGNWYDPVPTPGGKNTKSNDLDDFQKYYEEFCFDKKDKPVCEKEFMESLGLLKSDIIPAVDDGTAIPADTALDPNPDPALNPDAPITPTNETIIPEDATEEIVNETAPEEIIENIPEVVEEPIVVVDEAVAESKEDVAPEIKKEEEVKVAEPEEEVKPEEPKKPARNASPSDAGGEEANEIISEIFNFEIMQKFLC